jgi:hypothetical protein
MREVLGCIYQCWSVIYQPNISLGSNTRTRVVMFKSQIKTPTLESGVYIYIYIKIYHPSFIRMHLKFLCCIEHLKMANRTATRGVFSEKQRVGTAQIHGCVLKRFTIGIPCSLSQ